MMALTATATALTRKQVCRLLGMVHPDVVSESPNRTNIKYIVNIPSTMEEMFASLVEGCRLHFDKIIIFCRTYDDCSRIYMFIRSRLGSEGVEPSGAPDLTRFRLVDMFTACTHPPVKDAILASFSQPSSILRVVVATVAFGMGLDCPNVRRIIQGEASNDIEQYVQETGRAGRDGLPAQAILFHVPHPSNQFLDVAMKEYCKNRDRCRRQMLLKNFDGDIDSVVQCSCCDVCERKCVCSNCVSNS